MNKGMKTLALVLAIGTCASALTSCNTEDYTYPDAHWQDGLIVTVGGKLYEYKDIYELLDDSKDSAQALYNIAEDLAAQLATDATDDMRNGVDVSIANYEETWRSNASTNGTSYKEEMEKGLDGEGVDSIDELRLKLLSQKRITANENAYLQDQLDPNDTDNYGALYNISVDMTKKYVETQRPYHVSHILVKVDAAATSSDSTALYDGHISSDNATKLSQVIQALASRDSFGSVARIFSDDTGSQANYGDLGGTDSVGMELTTSYVSEFKLGLYAYDALLNNDVVGDEKEEVKSVTRMPGGEGVNSDYSDQAAWESTDLGSKKVFGIPLSVALELGEVAQQDKSDDGLTVQDTDETQYPRNILFNNYFNNHSLSFIYDDSADYLNADKTINYDKLIKEVQVIDSEITTIDQVKEKYPERYREYTDIAQNLAMIDTSKFSAANSNISDNLYTYKSTTSEYDTTGSDLTALPAGQKILVDQKGNPILVTRAGSDSYQGIHFITVNRDPFQTYYSDANKTVVSDSPETYYEYYRVNVPKAGATDASNPNYNEDPSYVNYILADPNSNTEYQDRIDAVKAAIQAFDPNMKFDRFENNLLEIGKKFSSLGVTSVDDVATKLFGEGNWALMKDYIQFTRDSSTGSNEDSLDEAWSAYTKLLNLQKDIVPKRVVPTVCISYFQNGEYDEKMEAICHVEE